jgi:DNA-binding response OmpR family regulator
MAGADHRRDAVPPDRARPTAAADREFELLLELADAIVGAAEALLGALEKRTEFDQAWQLIRELEHKGDAVARDLFEGLMVPQVHAVQPEVLKALTGYLDDVLDAIEAAAARLVIYRIRRIIPAVRQLAAVVVESAHELRQAIHQLQRMQEVFPHARTLHRLENRADDLLRDAIEALFAGRMNAKNVVKWKDICEILEASTDRCEDIANVLETYLVQTGREDRLVAGRLVMDIGRHEVTVAGTPVALSAKEFDLLHLLLRHQSKVVRRERLLQEVWGEDYFGDTRTLDTHIGWLRKKVESGAGVRILAMRGIGYRLDLRE